MSTPVSFSTGTEPEPVLTKSMQPPLPEIPLSQSPITESPQLQDSRPEATAFQAHIPPATYLPPKSAWEICLDYAKKRAHGEAEVWKDEVDKLLFFVRLNKYYPSLNANT